MLTTVASSCLHIGGHRRGSAPHPAGASPLRPSKNQKPSYEGLIQSVVSLPLVGPAHHQPVDALMSSSSQATLSERKATRC